MIVTATQFKKQYAQLPYNFLLSYHGVIAAHAKRTSELYNEITQPLCRKISYVQVSIHGCRPIIKQLKQGFITSVITPNAHSYRFVPLEGVNDITPNKKPKIA